MVAVIFPDGARYSAETWRELERELRADPWNPSLPEAFRKEMVHRAKVWGGVAVTPEGSSRRFFRELEKAGLFLIEEES